MVGEVVGSRGSDAQRTGDPAPSPSVENGLRARVCHGCDLVGYLSGSIAFSMEVSARNSDRQPVN